MPRLCLIGSFDTKGDLLERLRSKARAKGLRAAQVISVDARLARVGQLGKEAAMHKAARRLESILARAGPKCAYLALGGGTGSWVALKALSALPLGTPKVMVTTMAFDPRPLVAGTDIVIVPCPVDLMGDNPFLDAALSTGLDAALGIGLRPSPASIAESARPMVAITALGVVQRCVENVRERLEEEGHSSCVFHAAGANGRTLCRWIEEESFIKGVVDLAPNDLHVLFEGRKARGATGMNRLKAAVRARIPYLLVPGGLDFVSRPTDGLTDNERRQPRSVHSPTFTHVRTTRAQVARAAGFVARELRGKRSAAAVVVPTLGWSLANHKGGPLAAPGKDGAFVKEMYASGMPADKVVTARSHVNDASFARLVARTMARMLGQSAATGREPAKGSRR